MNIFSKLQVYAGKWEFKSSRKFESEELNAVEKAEVVASNYGNSVCFLMKSGGQTYIPLSSDSSLKVGDKVDLDKAEIITLEKSGESDIQRIRA